MHHAILKLCLLTFVVLPSLTMAQNDSLKVLFIGNSYTLYNNLPEKVAMLAKSDNIFLEQKSFTKVGGYLKSASQNKKVQEEIQTGNYDFIVLQEQSTTPLFKKNEWLYPAIRTFDTMATSANSKLILFQTWARKYADSIVVKQLPGMFYYDYFKNSAQAQESLNEAYQVIAEETGATVAPVGTVWQQVKGLDAGTSLWQEDHSHPTEYGTLITAFVIYTTLICLQRIIY